MSSLFITVFLFSIVQPVTIAGMHTDADTVDQYIRQRMEAEKIPGMSIATIESNGEIDFKNFGYADLEHQQAVDENTIYEIGSVTKTFTAGLIHIFMRDTEFTPVTPVNEILDNMVHIESYEGTQITLHHLLTHHSGLPRLPANLTPANPADPYRDYTDTMMYNFLDDYHLDHESGTRFAYSNLGYMLLGDIAEILGGESYDKLLVHNITEELDMTSTSRYLADSSRFATPTSGGFESHEWNFDGVKGLGGLRSTSSDMIKYLEMMMGITEYAFKDYFIRTTKPRVQIDENLHVGHSWFVNTAHDDKIVYHGGGTGGFSSFVGYSTVTRKGVIVLSNSTSDIQDIGLHLLNSDHNLHKIEEYQQLGTAQLQNLEGVYQSEMLPEFTIFRDGNQLYGQMEGQRPVPLNALSDREFENKALRARVTFGVSGDRADSLTLYQAGNSFSFERKEVIQTEKSPGEDKTGTEDLKEFTGIYTAARGMGMKMTIRLEEDYLTARLTGQNAFRIYPKKKDTFFLRVVEAELHFSRDGKGKINRVVLHQNNRETIFDRE